MENLIVNDVVRRRRRKAAKTMSVVEKVNIMLTQNAFALEEDEDRLEAKEIEKVAVAHILRVYGEQLFRSGCRARMQHTFT